MRELLNNINGTFVKKAANLGNELVAKAKAFFTSLTNVPALVAA